jgi:hypothetical protein
LLLDVQVKPIKCSVVTVSWTKWLIKFLTTSLNILLHSLCYFSVFHISSFHSSIIQCMCVCEIVWSVPFLLVLEPSPDHSVCLICVEDYDWNSTKEYIHLFFTCNNNYIFLNFSSILYNSQLLILYCYILLLLRCFLWKWN